MIEVGRLCVKTAGRDSGLKCAVVEVLDKNFVIIDGETRRKRCNIIHLEPLSELIKIKAKASHEEVASELKKMGIEARKTNPKQAAEKPSRQRKAAEKPAEEKKAKPAKKAKEEPKPAQKKKAKKAEE